MHCKTCDYPLWNLSARQCPECGAAFLPSEFEFVLNSVRFCCQHCNQVYYGTTEQGHLDPLEFDCVSCGRHVAMDEMVLRPAEGLEEQETRPDRMPWLERREMGRAKAWFSMLWMSMLQPNRLIKATPPESSTGQAWWFAIATWVLLSLAGFGAPLVLFGAFLLIMGESEGLGMMVAALGFMVGWPLTVLGLMLVWGVSTHLILKATGGATFSMGRTFQAICYSAGANALWAIPCVGPYCGTYVVPIWWVISAILMVAIGQRVHGGRAALAVLALPVSVILLFALAYAGFLFLLISSPATLGIAGPVSGTNEVMTVTRGVLDHGAVNEGDGPDHAVMLVTGQTLAMSDVISLGSDTIESDVPVADTTLDALVLLGPNRQALAAASAAEALPEGTVAHRLGDFVFTYHGIDLLVPADPKLWIVVQSYDPDAALSPPAASMAVGLADGSVQVIAGDPAAALAEQNVLRGSLGLPPLPDPAQVTHDEPAVIRSDPP